jgi:hypothetical protein
MADPKMVILRGNSAGAGSYPDEQGKTIAWPIGALHVQAATDYAKRRGYEGVVLPLAGQPQSQHSPQAKAALKAFLEDPAFAAFYGFSGGGYNLRHILEYLAANEPQSLRRVTLVVVIGAPITHGKRAFEPANYNATARAKLKGQGWQDAKWEVVYRTNPKHSQMPAGLPKGIGTHMFGPDVLLSGWPEE